VIWNQPHSPTDGDHNARAVSERQPEWCLRKPVTAAGAGQQASHERRQPRVTRIIREGSPWMGCAFVSIERTRTRIAAAWPAIEARGFAIWCGLKKIRLRH